MSMIKNRKRISLIAFCSILIFSSSIISGNALTNRGMESNKTNLNSENKELVQNFSIRANQGTIEGINESLIGLWEDSVQNFIDYIHNVIKPSNPDLYLMENGYSPAHMEDGVFKAGKWEPEVDIKAKKIDNTIKNDENIIHVGDNLFDNTQSSYDQSYNTTSFSRTDSYTTSTQITTGFTNSTTASISIPLEFKPGISTTLTFNTSKTDANSYTQSSTYNAPSQNIKVPAGKKYKVSTYFAKYKASGMVELTADVKHYFGKNSKGYEEPFDPKDIYPITDFYKDAIKWGTPDHGFTLSPDDSEALRKTGTGKFTTEYGTGFSVKTVDITDSDNPIEIRSEFIPVEK